jgi:hypothetical protein
MRGIGEYRADGLIGQVQEAVTAFSPGHTFTGRLDCEG